MGGRLLTRDDALRLSIIGGGAGDGEEGLRWAAPLPEEDSESDDDEGVGDDLFGDGFGLAGSGAGSGGGAGGSSAAGGKGGVDFEKQVEELVRGAFEEGHDLHPVQMEVLSLKLSHNKSFCDTLRGVVPALLGAALAAAQGGGAMGWVRQVRAAFGSADGWASALVEVLVQGEEEELGVVCALEDFVLRHLPGAGACEAVRYVLQILLDAEVLSREGLQRWAETRETMTTMTKIVGTTRRRNEAVSGLVAASHVHI